MLSNSNKRKLRSDSVGSETDERQHAAQFLLDLREDSNAGAYFGMSAQHLPLQC